MKVKVATTIDKPLEILGLEPPETALVFVVTGLVFLFVSAVVSLAVLFISWIALVKIKKNKPRGYVVHKVTRFFGTIGRLKYPKGVYRP